MSAQNPTPDDLRTLAKNLKSEKQTSRAEVLANAAAELERLQEHNKNLSHTHLEDRTEIAKLRADLGVATATLSQIQIGFISSKEMRIIARDTLRKFAEGGDK